MFFKPITLQIHSLGLISWTGIVSLAVHILQGYLTGLAMIVFIGPVFFLLLTTSLEKGVRAGLAVALGIIVSDVVCVLLCYYGLARFLTAEASQFWMALLGSFLLLGMGLSYLLKQPKAPLEVEQVKEGKNTSFFVKGFLVNFVNPFVFLVWLGIIEVAKAQSETETSMLWYLAAVLLGILTVDVSKVILAERIKPLVKTKVLIWLYRVSGVVMVTFGIRLLFFTF